MDLCPQHCGVLHSFPSRVLQLMNLTDSRLAQAGNEKLELAMLSFFEQFRKIYIGDQVQKSSKVKNISSHYRIFHNVFTISFIKTLHLQIILGRCGASGFSDRGLQNRFPNILPATVAATFRSKVGSHTGHK